jgi:hypothetical protein
MPSLVSLAFQDKWDKCRAMLDRGKGDVHERGPVRSALTYHTPACRHCTTFPPLPAVRAGPI